MTRFVPRALRGQRAGSDPASGTQSAAGPEADRDPGRQPTPRPRPAAGPARSSGTPPRPRSGAASPVATTPGRRAVAAPRTGSNRGTQVAEAAVARLRRTAVALVIWIVVSALAGGTAWYFKQQSDVIETARREALAAAEEAAEAIFSYDYRAFDESVSNGKDYVTGDFAREYAKITAGLEALARKEKAIVRARVSAKGVGEVTPRRVEVLLFVNQYKRNVNITGEKVDENRVVLTMVYVPDRPGGGEWLAAGAVAI